MHARPFWIVEFGRDFLAYCKARIVLWVLRRRYVRRRVGRREIMTQISSHERNHNAVALGEKVSCRLCFAQQIGLFDCLKSVIKPVNHVSISKILEVSKRKLHEHLIVIELKGVIDSDFLYKCKSESCRLLGIDTDEPVLQIGNYTFTGELKEPIGTHVLFEELESSDSQETKKLKYRYNTTKTLEMARVFLVKKDSAEKEEEEV
ncbi:unnamed protein product, partial [Porites evermanni]